MQTKSYKGVLILTDASYADAAKVEAALYELVKDVEDGKTGATLVIERFSARRGSGRPMADEPKAAPEYEEVPAGVDEYVWRFLCVVYPSGPHLALASFNERHTIETGTAMLRRAARIEDAAQRSSDTYWAYRNRGALPAPTEYAAIVEAQVALREALDS